MEEQKIKDLTPLIPELKESIPPFIPEEAKDGLVNALFFILAM